MDKWIQELEQFTNDLVERLQLFSYEELVDMIDRRGTLINQLQEMQISSEDREKYRETVERILSYDPVILGRLRELKNEASQGMQKINSGRKQKSAYERAFISDGAFFDKRK